MCYLLNRGAKGDAREGWRRALIRCQAATIAASVEEKVGTVTCREPFEGVGDAVNGSFLYLNVVTATVLPTINDIRSPTCSRRNATISSYGFSRCRVKKTKGRLESCKGRFYSERSTLFFFTRAIFGELLGGFRPPLAGACNMIV